MNKRWLVPAGLAAATLIAAGCGSSGGTSGAGGNPAGHARSAGPASSGSSIKTTKIGGATVLTTSRGFALYWFAPDTSTTSNCNGSCATFWPPMKGPVTGTGIKGTFGTITRSDGSSQATFDGHPLYTYKGDTKPGEATGNGVNINGGVWHEVTTTRAAPAASPTSTPTSGGAGRYGY